MWARVAERHATIHQAAVWTACTLLPHVTEHLVRDLTQGLAEGALAGDERVVHDACRLCQGVRGRGVKGRWRGRGRWSTAQQVHRWSTPVLGDGNAILGDSNAIFGAALCNEPVQ